MERLQRAPDALSLDGIAVLIDEAEEELRVRRSGWLGLGFVGRRPVIRAAVRTVRSVGWATVCQTAVFVCGYEGCGCCAGWWARISGLAFTVAIVLLGSGFPLFGF